MCADQWIIQVWTTDWFFVDAFDNFSTALEGLAKRRLNAHYKYRLIVILGV